VHFCEFVHRVLIENAKKPEKLYIPNTELSDYECMSIQCISWRGADMKNGIPTEEEESWIAFFYPLLANKTNILYGSCVVGHYSCYNQLSYLNTTDVLSKYKELS
jgi:hypothetical protein